MSQSSENGSLPAPCGQENFFFDALDLEIADLVSKLNQTLALLLPERNHVLSRLQALVDKTFPYEHPKIELFGSLITGLALESSDMDIAVVGLEISDRYAMIEDLKKLASVL